jgi:hypothetical protein
VDGNFNATYVSGDVNVNGKLDFGEVWLFTSAGHTLVLGVGTFPDTATVTGTNGSPVSAQDSASVTGQPTQLVLVKAINAFDPAHPDYFEDANTAPGQYLPIGSTATFTFAVSLIGLASVSNVVVTDAPAMGIAAVTKGNGKNVGDLDDDGLLDPGEIWIFKATGLVASGLHTDTGTVTGTDTVTSTTLTKTDTANYTGTTGITIVKSVNGVDANDPTHPYLIAAGGSVVWTYVVTNQTNGNLTNVKVIDDNGTPGNTADDITLTVPTSGDSNHDGVLAKNETWVFTAPARSAVAGLYTNVANVSAKVSASSSVFDNDPASYFGWIVQLHVVKATNAQDPDNPTSLEDGNTAPGQIFPIGTPVIWTYQVTNTGNLAVPVSLRDDFGTASNAADDFTPKYVKGDTNLNGLLDPGEVWLYTSSGVVSYNVKDGQYMNVATASTTDPDGIPDTARDRSYHSGATTPFTITKAVNAADPWHPTAYEDANSPVGVVLTVGVTVTWTYLVRNNGTAPIDLTSVTDDGGVLGSIAFLPDSVNTFDPGFNDGDLNHNSLLDPGETWLFRATGTVPSEQYTNTATATGVAIIGGLHIPLAPVTDVANLYGTPIDPTIHVVKKVNGFDANTPADAVYVIAGSTVTWTYTVTSSAQLAVTLTDDNGTPGNSGDDFHPTFQGGDSNNNGLLDPGETWTYVAAGVVPAGFFGNVALAKGTSGSTTVYDDDLAYAFGAAPKIAIVKAVNALDPLHPTSIERSDGTWRELLVGTKATFTYLVTNTGNIRLLVDKPVGVVDDDGTPGTTADDFFAAYVSGDANGDGYLDLNEVWLYQAAPVTVLVGAYVNTAKVTGSEPRTSQIVTAQDSAGYFGDAKAEGLTPGFWKNNADNKSAIAWPRDASGNLIWDPGQALSTMFPALLTIGSPYADISLADGLALQGGGLAALLRHAISGVLAATSPYVAYPLTASAVINAVDAAILGGDATTITNLQNTLAGYNNAEADLDANGLIPVPTLSISSAQVTEGNSGTTTVNVVVSLSGPAQNTVAVTWSTVAGTALAGSDFVAGSGTIFFVPGGAMSIAIPITIVGDTAIEPDETFTVALSNLANATGGGAGTVTILNDDSNSGQTTAGVAATDAGGAEQGTDPIVFTITRSGSTTAAVTINLGWSGGATFGTDYTVTATGGTLGPNATTLTLAAGATSATVKITPVDDHTVEGAESVVLSLASGVGYVVGSPPSATGSIADNDTPPTISIGNAQVTEGDKKTSNATITVTLSNAWSSSITVHVATANGAALAGSDYTAMSTNLTFAAGVTSVTFTVAIIGDTVKESTETFTVVLSAPTGGATIAVGTGTVTIIDNDAAMMAASSAPAGVHAQALTAAELAPVVTQAEELWRSALSGADFRGLSVAIADLPGDQLGWTVGKDMTIDATAAGFGWDRIDLLTVVLHELGRSLGLTTADAAWFGVMAPTLAPSERLALRPVKWIGPQRVRLIHGGRKVVKSALMP